MIGDRMKTIFSDRIESQNKTVHYGKRNSCGNIRVYWGCPGLFRDYPGLFRDSSVTICF